TVNATPAAPGAATPEALCGPAAVMLVASGGSNGQYVWYTDASGGTAIAGQTNNSFTTPELTTTTTYYVALKTGACESPRAPITATINACDIVVYNAVSPNGD